MKTLKLRTFTRVHWLVLGLLCVGMAFVLATPSARQWVRHRVETLGGLLPKAQTQMQRIATMSSGTPVFIDDCDGGATQQVRVEELTDRPGHLVVLHLGTQVLGTKTAPPMTTTRMARPDASNGSASNVLQLTVPPALEAQ